MFVLFSQINNNVLRLQVALKNLYHINNEFPNMDDNIEDMNIDEEVFPQINVEFTNISVISEEMKKG